MVKFHFRNTKMVTHKEYLPRPFFENHGIDSTFSGPYLPVKHETLLFRLHNDWYIAGKRDQTSKIKDTDKSRQSSKLKEISRQRFCRIQSIFGSIHTGRSKRVTSKVSGISHKSNLSMFNEMYSPLHIVLSDKANFYSSCRCDNISW